MDPRQQGALPDIAELVNSALLDEEIVPVASRRLVHADELDQIAAPAWLIPREIAERSFSLLIGAVGIGKSFVALDYALRVAQVHPVVYLAAEGASGYSKRKNAWRTFHGQGSGSLYFHLGAVNMLQPAEVQLFLDQIRSLSPKLIVVDTLNRCMAGGDENNSRDMGLFIAACERIRTEIGAAILVVHHLGKSGALERGHSSLRGASDTIIKLETSRNLLKLVCDKSKDEAPFPARILELLPVGASCVLNEVEVRPELKTTSMQPRHWQVLDILGRPAHVKAGVKVAQLVILSQIAESSVYKIITDLRTLGFVAPSERGHPVRITPKGIEALQGT